MTVSCERLDIYIAGKLCGVLTQNRNGALSFEYVHHYEGVPLSVSMPVGLERYGDRTVRPYLMGLLPDNASTRSLIGSKFGVSGNNPFKLLSNIGLDCPGAVQVCPHETDFELRNAEKGLVALSSADIESKLAAVRDNAAAAWIDAEETQGRWSLAGCQAKFALRRQSGNWYDCIGGAASTHIFKPGVVGFDRQALVEYLSMKTAQALGLPTARTEYLTFGSESAIVVERYDRAANGKGKVIRIHQEDLCQALGVSPDAKYAEQGGPTTPQIIELLKKTGANATSNVHRFILYIFFNYLIGATDAHAKNHSLLLVAPDDIRLAPLYDVASIAPYRSLAPSARKPPRTALSIGGENRFGMLKKKHVEKMVVSCRLEELDIGADTLCEQFEIMARMVPQVLASVIEEARLQKVIGIDDIAERMQTEISANCARFLS